MCVGPVAKTPTSGVVTVAGTRKAPAQIKGRRRHTLSKKFKDLPMKPRGAPDGPKRTPLHLADAWQKDDGYEVEKVGIAMYCPSRSAACYCFSRCR